jgi:hypothetical protein
MIIGISGKKGHGKDTVAKIIQYLLFIRHLEKVQESQPHYQFFGTNRNTTLESFINFWDQEQRDVHSTYKKKMFAGKLKEMVCLLIGCTMQQLEDQDFKEKPLGEEWRQWFNSNYELIDEKDRDDSSWSELLTPRKLLQLLGTDCGRQIIHPNIWVNSTMSEYKSIIKRHRESGIRGEDGNWYIPQGHKALTIPEFPMQIQDRYFEWEENLGEPNWIITDVRFINECRAIKKYDGLLIRVNRPGIDSTSTHESETA